jgi:hypothetical protein
MCPILKGVRHLEPFDKLRTGAVERSHLIGRATTGFLDAARNDKLNHKNAPVMGLLAKPADPSQYLKRMR